MIWWIELSPCLRISNVSVRNFFFVPTSSTTSLRARGERQGEEEGDGERIVLEGGRTMECIMEGIILGSHHTLLRNLLATEIMRITEVMVIMVLEIGERIGDRQGEREARVETREVKIGPTTIGAVGMSRRQALKPPLKTLMQTFILPVLRSMARLRGMLKALRISRETVIFRGVVAARAAVIPPAIPTTT